jgi:acyl-CoA thioesterase FadM
MLALDGVFITKRAHVEYKHETYPFQKIKATLNVKNMKKSSFDIIIKFYLADSEIIVAEGYQTIVFASKNKKIIKLPENIKNKMLAYAIF